MLTVIKCGMVAPTTTRTRREIRAEIDAEMDSLLCVPSEALAEEIIAAINALLTELRCAENDV